ncbi:MAG TPA: hypothetical protein HA257_02870 [Candidatus Methanoperedenaceae archaeon]|nr:hypothetical protein [Candidatus Methanoperedenaceae archaeon]
MILELDFLLQSIGIIGIIVFYIVLAKLSARMGEGLMLAPYYRWYYVSCIIISLTIPVHIYLHQRYEMPHSVESLDMQGLYFSLLLIGNLIAILVSFRYWWWLKDEIFKRVL